MGSFYNSNADIIYKIINTLGGLAGIGCTLMILVSGLKMIIGDENERNIYVRRVKNGVIALILILTIVSVVQLVGKYFPVNKNYSSIGDFSDKSVSMIQGVSNAVNETRQLVSIDGTIYVKTKENVEFDVDPGLFSTKKIMLDEYKLYSEAGGATKGAFADVQYVFFKHQIGTNLLGEDGDKGMKNRFVTYNSLKEAKKSGDIADGDGFKNFISTYGVEVKDSNGIKWLDGKENPFDTRFDVEEEQKSLEDIKKENGLDGKDFDELEKEAEESAEDQAIWWK